MRSVFNTLFVILLLSACSPEENPVFHQGQTPKMRWGTPPFDGTIFLDPDIIIPTDSSAFANLEEAGRGERVIYDRRVSNWITINAHLFEAYYEDGLTIEVQINPEFSASEAKAEAMKYAISVGLLPTSLRLDVDALWINKGVEPFGGGNRSILIHTGQSFDYEKDGILEETLVHEAAHTSLDDPHATHYKWIEAQVNDANFISTYARDNPEREDIAETYLLHLALRHRSDRISAELKNTILETIPNRIEYLDNINLDMYPIVN